MTTIVVDATTLEFMNMWPSSTVNPPTVTGPNPQVSLETSEDPSVLVASKDPETGEITLVPDPTKVQARLDAQWTQVRSQQRQKLYESDWTCSVTDYEVPNKSEWRDYRSRLRDVTLQSDPFEIVWPVAPEA